VLKEFSLKQYKRLAFLTGAFTRLASSTPALVMPPLNGIIDYVLV